jgi:hypothetical protein
MNQLTTTPVQPLTLCHMPKGDRPIDLAIWYFSDANGDVWAARSLLGLIARTHRTRGQAIAAAECHGHHFQIFGEKS